MGRHLLRAVLAVSVAASGCSLLVDDTLSSKGAMDAAVDAAADAGPCDAASDGTACGEGLVCVSGLCQMSVCGDGVVDMARGEECEDGNDEPGDGCEPEVCVLTCSGDEACDDGNPCSGAESCGDDNTCQAGSPLAQGADCATGEISDGVCSSGGICVPRGCGDGVVAGDEQCDDMNSEEGDGCEPDCTFTCEADDDCVDGSFCNGEESCDTEMHVCLPGTAVECEPSDACHTARCSEMEGMCVQELIDGDSDGEAATSLGACGTDCDDGDAERAAGNTELCGNGIDDDCDPATSDTAMTLFYPDCDEDGYAVMGASGLAACMEPGSCGGCGCTAQAPTSAANSDCSDQSEDARPGQTMYFGSRIPGEPSSTDYDYDCDGTESRQVTCVNEPTDGSCPSYDILTRCSPRTICFPTCCATGGGSGGWTGSFVPSCGSTAQYSSCVPLFNPVTRQFNCIRRTINRQQLCR